MNNDVEDEFEDLGPQPNEQIEDCRVAIVEDARVGWMMHPDTGQKTIALDLGIEEYKFFSIPVLLAEKIVQAINTNISLIRQQN